MTIKNLSISIRIKWILLHKTVWASMYCEPLQWLYHVNAHTSTVGPVKPSPYPTVSSRSGSRSHIGHFLLRTLDARIQTIRLYLQPEVIEYAPCLCWPRCKIPVHGLCGYRFQFFSLSGSFLIDPKNKSPPL